MIKRELLEDYHRQKVKKTALKKYFAVIMAFSIYNYETGTGTDGNRRSKNQYHSV